MTRTQVAILAGGRGTRLGPHTSRTPKPMLDVGGRPLLSHIMRHYERHGFGRFVVAAGYRAEVVRRAFAGDERVRVVDTGADTGTGGRVRRLAPVLGGETFMLTWGDGLSDVDLTALLRFHRAHGRLATVTAVHPRSQFGHLDLDGDEVRRFREKPRMDDVWVNGAYFVLEPAVVGYIDGDATMFEHEPLTRLAADGELRAFRHDGFWSCVDTAADLDAVRRLWDGGRAPWERAA